MQSPCKLMSRGHYIGRILLVLALLCVAALQPAFGQSFTVKDLGTIPNGLESVARGINNCGQVVGESATSELHPPHAFLFENGVMVDLGTFPGTGVSSAAGINNRGQVVGVSFAFPFPSIAFLFEHGVMVSLGTLPGGRPFAAALIINHRRQVGGSATTANAAIHASLFETGAMDDLAPLPGDHLGHANGSNNRGHNAGCSTPPNPPMHA